MTDSKTNEVVVEQCDRDAAASVYQHFRDHDYAGWVRHGSNATGAYDWCVQLFARHRLTASEPLLAQARAQAVEDAWQPIERAPKDGSWFIAAKFGRGDGLLYVRDCQWISADQYQDEYDDWLESEIDDTEASEGFIDNDGEQRFPTHWMPLRPPPALAQSEGEGKA
jgi:hypothetical protein